MAGFSSKAKAQHQWPARIRLRFDRRRSNTCTALTHGPKPKRHRAECGVALDITLSSAPLFNVQRSEEPASRSLTNPQQATHGLDRPVSRPIKSERRRASQLRRREARSDRWHSAHTRIGKLAAPLASTNSNHTDHNLPLRGSPPVRMELGLGLLQVRAQ